MTDVVVTREQVIDLIKSEKMKPSDLFDIASMEADPIVRGLSEDRVKERIAGEYRRRRDAEEKLEKLQGEVAPEKDKLLKQITDLKVSAAKSQLGSLLDKQKTERKLDDRQLKFVQNRLSRFDVKNPDEIEKEFATFLDGEVDEYTRIAKEVFGIEAKQSGATDGKDNAATGTEPDEKKAAVTDNKYLDPAKNPMIRI